MRVVVRHGHFAFYPRDREEVLHFRRRFSLSLESERDYFTFSALAGLPRWSQVGRPYCGLPALVNYEGRDCADVLRANGFVYSFSTELAVPAATYLAAQANFRQSRDTLLAQRALVQPGVLLSIDNVPRGQLLSYTGELNITEQRLSVDSVEVAE